MAATKLSAWVATDLANELMGVVGSLRSQIVPTRAVPDAYPR
jgi:hypothetical protein